MIIMLARMLKMNLQNAHYDFQRHGTYPRVPAVVRGIITREDS